MSNYTKVLNGPASGEVMLTWYQGNFTEVLNRLSSCEAIPGKRRGAEHTLDSA